MWIFKYSSLVDILLIIKVFLLSLRPVSIFIISSSGLKVAIFCCREKIQFGYVLETFENYNKRKTLVGPQVIPRSLALPNEAKWLQKSDVLLWKT